MALFTSGGTRQDTQLAYKVRCSPYAALSPAARKLISWRRHTFLTKNQIASLCNEDQTKILCNGREFTIVWVNNNVPNEVEWNRTADEWLMAVDFRCSPAIKEFAVAVLDFGLGRAAGGQNVWGDQA